MRVQIPPSLPKPTKWQIMNKFPFQERFIAALDKPADKGKEIWRMTLDALSMYQKIRNLRPKEQPIDVLDKDMIDTMIAGIIKIIIDEPADEKFQECIHKRKELELESDFWRPVISLRKQMAAKYWEPKIRNQGSYPAHMYMAIDFRLDITGQEWNEIGTISRNYGADVRKSESIHRPTTLDYLPKSNACNNMHDDNIISAILDNAKPWQILIARHRAARKALEMRKKLIANPNEYMKTAAIICATNGYVNSAVMKHLQTLAQTKQ